MKLPCDCPCDSVCGEIGADVWVSIFMALAGEGVPDDRFIDAYDLSEKIKRHASDIHTNPDYPFSESMRATAYLLHAFIHWCRTWRKENIDASAWRYVSTLDEMNFRTYLAAWISSVGIDRLNMLPEDVRAINAITGVSPMFHPLLPAGRSY